MTLEQVLSFAIKTPFYKDYLQNNSQLSLELFPVIEKKTIVDRIEEFCIPNDDTSNVVKTQTSGSSGIVFDVYWKVLDYYNSMIEVWMVREKMGILPQDRYCSLHVAYNLNGKICRNKVIVNKNNISLSKCFCDAQSIGYYHKVLEEFKPKWMLVQPSFLYSYLYTLKELGLSLTNSIELIELTGEFCPEALLDTFKKMYPHIKWRVMYGMQEFNVIGYGDSTALNILNNNVFVEILNNTGEAVSTGEKGEIVVTSLKNTYMPLVRYKTGDYGYWNNDGSLVISRSRSNDYIQFNSKKYDGSIFWGIVLILNVDYDCQIKHFQVVFNGVDIEFNIVSARNTFDKHIIEDFIERYLKKVYMIEYPVRVVFREQINAQENKNKIKYFINTQLEE